MKNRDSLGTFPWLKEDILTMENLHAQPDLRTKIIARLLQLCETPFVEIVPVLKGNMFLTNRSCYENHNGKSILDCYQLWFNQGIAKFMSVPWIFHKKRKQTYFKRQVWIIWCFYNFVDRYQVTHFRNFCEMAHQELLTT